MKKCKLLLFDLDGTLLQSEKTISTRTLSALKKCREKDILIGVSTSRSEQNSLVFLNELMPDILISSGGALVKYKTEYIYRAEFSEEETKVMIDMARANNPLKKKQSVIAISCKLIRVFYAILAKGVTYDAQKLISDIHRQPQAA
jgi:HAD superfamily hydrolase (TIGR01484 family)